MNPRPREGGSARDFGSHGGTTLAAKCDVARSSTRQEHELSPEAKLPPRGIGHWFTRFSQRAAGVSGSPWVFIVVVGSMLMWLVTGPIFAFSDSWQLIANTVTTLATTILVVLIQNTQNRDSRAIHLNL